MYQVELSEKQAEVLAFIKSFSKKEGWPPTLTEIGAEMINIKSASGKGITVTAVVSRLNGLIKYGAVVKKGNHARSIKVVPRFKVVIKGSKK